MIETFWQDLRHGARMLAKNPGFRRGRDLSIAIGVGANAAMFSLADGLVLRPLKVPRSTEIVAVGATAPHGRTRASSPAASRPGLPRLARSRAELQWLLAYRTW